MRIAYLSADFGVPIPGQKGAAIHVREMVRAFRTAGHDVTVYSPAVDAEALAALEGSISANGGGAERGWLHGAGAVRVAPDPRHVAMLDELARVEERFEMKTRLRQELRNLFYASTLLESLRMALAREPVDFVYERYALFSHAGARLAHTLGVPHLLEVNAPLADEQERTRGLVLGQVARDSEGAILRGADALLVVSSALERFAIARGVDAARVHVVPNGVDPAMFADALPAEGARARGDEIVIGFSGSLKPWHGVETLLEAFARLHRTHPATRLLLVGDGPRREALEAQAHELGIADAVRFAGVVPYDEVPRWLAAMDVAVAPYTPHEDFYFSPIKIFEYLAAGRAVVAAAIGQVNELLVHDRLALLYPPGDVDALAATLARAIDDAPLRKALGERGAEWVRRERTWAANAERVVAIARERIEARGAGGREATGAERHATLPVIVTSIAEVTFANTPQGGTRSGS
jgi:glycosyltransferase involved in cell wall biosynthesis